MKKTILSILLCSVYFISFSQKNLPLIFDDGEKHVGSWKNDTFNGKGTIIYKNGNKTSGNFKNLLPHGKHTFVAKNGLKEIRTFKEGELIKLKKTN